MQTGLLLSQHSDVYPSEPELEESYPSEISSEAEAVFYQRYLQVRLEHWRVNVRQPKTKLFKTVACAIVFHTVFPFGPWDLLPLMLMRAYWRQHSEARKEHLQYHCELGNPCPDAVRETIRSLGIPNQDSDWTLTPQELLEAAICRFELIQELPASERPTLMRIQRLALPPGI